MTYNEVIDWAWVTAYMFFQGTLALVISFPFIKGFFESLKDGENE